MKEQTTSTTCATISRALIECVTRSRDWEGEVYQVPMPFCPLICASMATVSWLPKGPPAWLAAHNFYVTTWQSAIFTCKPT